MTPFLMTAGWTIGALLLLAGLLHLLPRLGSLGRRASDACCRAPVLDWVITYFTVAPMFVAPFFYGWRGFAGAVAGQVATVLIWTALHELANPEARRGPRILKFSNALIGRWRNYTATWLTAIVTPLFWVTRLAEAFVYPPIAWLTGFPRYRGAEWVNVSRHKFSGLVGHDLIWCLYCDWMTGVWSLGSEMLRNVESFWCPIRFRSDKKCANCAHDFPDVEQGWVDARGNMADVQRTLESMYRGQTPRAWFKSPIRVTVNGQAMPEPEPELVAK
jgi:hypothetical protein